MNAKTAKLINKACGIFGANRRRSKRAFSRLTPRLKAATRADLQERIKKS